MLHMLYYAATYTEQLPPVNEQYTETKSKLIRQESVKVSFH